MGTYQKGSSFGHLAALMDRSADPLWATDPMNKEQCLETLKFLLAGELSANTSGLGKVKLKKLFFRST